MIGERDVVWATEVLMDQVPGWTVATTVDLKVEAGTDPLMDGREEMEEEEE